MREKVASLMEMTQRSEEEVCCALYECDNDMDRAVEFLLETLPVVSFFFSKFWQKIRLLGLLVYGEGFLQLFFFSDLHFMNCVI